MTCSSCIHADVRFAKDYHLVPSHMLQHLMGVCACSGVEPSSLAGVLTTCNIDGSLYDVVIRTHVPCQVRCTITTG